MVKGVGLAKNTPANKKNREIQLSKFHWGVTIVNNEWILNTNLKS